MEDWFLIRILIWYVSWLLMSLFRCLQLEMYTIKYAWEFSYKFVQNWFVNQDYLSMTLFQGGIIQVKGTFQSTIVATLNVKKNLTLKMTKFAKKKWWRITWLQLLNTCIATVHGIIWLKPLNTCIATVHGKKKTQKTCSFRKSHKKL